MKYCLISLLVSALLLTIIAGAAAQISDDKVAAANNLLERNDINVGIAIDQFIDYKNGGGVVSGYQMHQGLKVFDARLTYHFAPGGETVRMPDGSGYSMGEVQDLTGVEIDADVLIDADAAIAQVRNATEEPGSHAIDADTLVSVQRCVESSDRLDIGLGILQRRLAWQIRCKYSRAHGIFIDAVTGDLMTFKSASRPGPLPIPLPVPGPVPASDD